jgi:hypothetical protein
MNSLILWKNQCLFQSNTFIKKKAVGGSTKHVDKPINNTLINKKTFIKMLLTGVAHTPPTAAIFYNNSNLINKKNNF